MSPLWQAMDALLNKHKTLLCNQPHDRILSWGSISNYENVPLQNTPCCIESFESLPPHNIKRVIPSGIRRTVLLFPIFRLCSVKILPKLSVLNKLYIFRCGGDEFVYGEIVTKSNYCSKPRCFTAGRISFVRPDIRAIPRRIFALSCKQRHTICKNEEIFCFFY